MMEPVLDKYWSQLASRHDPSAFATLDAAYREPQRAYHAWGHIVDILTKLDRLASLATRPDLIAAAAFWHDAVYLTRGPDGRPRLDPVNVRESAALFERHSRFDPMEQAAVRDIIMATADHMKAKATTEHYPGFSRDLDLFLDLDLSSLAAAWPVFEKNLGDIRYEFGWIPETDFYEGRTRMLGSFLRGGAGLYRLDETRALWLAPALANLRRADFELRERLARASVAN
ncbi:MAG: HD domain-containing protein [Methylocystis sp.]|uniref:HD domain-containing protein n=1 Tax=Methylocystis sp. TaxID=1911079 RepID=UPI003DA44016